jgi:signal transduction histidine kinase
VLYLLLALQALLTDEADRMGVRMGPTERPAHPPEGTGPAVGPLFRRIDLIILPIVFAFDVLVFSQFLRTDVITPAQQVGVVCYSVVGIGLLIFRRRAPLLVFGALLVLSMLAILLTDLYSPVLPLLVALAAVAELRPLRVSVGALAIVVLPTVLLVVDAAQAASPQAVVTATIGSALFYCAVDALAWGIGRWARRQRRQVDSLQALHTAQVQEQQAETENAILAERLRIAGELHDIVAHSVTIMVLHAAGAKRVVDTDPDRAKESMTTIEASGRQAMGELRRLLELLRDDEGRTLTTGSPLPGLAQLDTTISSVRGSGVTVALEVHGEARRLDASTDLAAYRLIQEGLTNVTKHCGAGARATVSLDWSADKLTVAVEDDGAGANRLAASMSTGNGLAGLRERVAVAGGDFVAGPTEAGGFRVAARLPVAEAGDPTESRQGTMPDRSTGTLPEQATGPGSAGMARPDDSTGLARIDP